VKRTADDPNNLKWGLGWGAHAELAMLPLLKLGPYYLHYELPGADLSSSTTEDAAFNVLGLRARILLPIPGSNIRPYGFVGLGSEDANGDAGVSVVEAAGDPGLIADDEDEIPGRQGESDWPPDRGVRQRIGTGGDVVSGRRAIKLLPTSIGQDNAQYAIDRRFQSASYS